MTDPFPRDALRAIGALRLIDQLEDGEMLNLAGEVKKITGEFLRIVGPPPKPPTRLASITIRESGAK